MSARKDKIINSVIEKILKRSEAGYKKYGVGLDKDEQTLDTWPVSYTHLTLPTKA